MGILSVVGTPIGNLGDMTYRAVETLEKADFICAEDTRVTAKLLNYFDIKTPLVSYHEHNAKQVGEHFEQDNGRRERRYRNRRWYALHFRPWGASCEAVR